MTNEKKTVYIAVLTGGVIRKEVNQFLLKLFAKPETRFNILIRHEYDSPVDSCRNKIALHFLESNADYLLMIDDDQIIHQSPLDLIEDDPDVVGQPTPIFRPDITDHPFAWNLWIEDENGNHKRGVIQADRGRFVEVAAIGTGVMLIARRVLEHPDMRAPFLTSFKPDGSRDAGEDVTFCHRARAAGFKVYAAMDQICGHVKPIDLLYCMTMLNEAQQRATAEYTPPSWAFTGKRLVFSVNPGRCGTAYLARVLDTIPGVRAYHEPEPAFHHVLRAVQENPGDAYGFWLDSKLPYITAEDCQVYIETSHLFGQGFATALLDMNLVPDLLIIRRPPREVALSMWRRGAIPGRTELGLTYHMDPPWIDFSPAALGMVLSFSKWTDYQNCYGHAVQMKHRGEYLARRFSRHGARIAETTTAELVTRAGFKRLVSELALPSPDWKAYHQVCSEVVSATKAEKRELMPDGDLDEQEAIFDG